MTTIPHDNVPDTGERHPCPVERSTAFASEPVSQAYSLLRSIPDVDVAPQPGRPQLDEIVAAMSAPESV